MTLEEALVKASTICAQQEKCIFDIEQKLNTWKIEPELQGKIIDKLIQEKFIDENRYVNFYTKDKFRFNRWGKIKIKWQLKSKNIYGSIVDDALRQIDNKEYKDVLAQLLVQKRKNIKDEDIYKIKNSLLRYASSRGFEPPVIYEVMEETGIVKPVN